MRVTKARYSGDNFDDPEDLYDEENDSQSVKQPAKRQRVASESKRSRAEVEKDEPVAKKAIFKTPEPMRPAPGSDN